jgi:hypothetical protein
MVVIHSLNVECVDVSCDRQGGITAKVALILSGVQGMAMVLLVLNILPVLLGLV